MKWSLLVLALSVSSLHAAEDYCGRCGKQHFLPKPINPQPGRKYARDRLVDLLHLKLDVTPDFKQRTIVAVTEWKFQPIGRPLSDLVLDAVGLSIDSVAAAGATLGEHQNTGEQLLLHFASPVQPETTVTVTIKHHVQPENGIYFRTPEMGYKDGDTQLWTQGEAELHRYWFPCYDYPNERFTSEVICHVPTGMEVVSNGKLVSSAPATTPGYTTFHWLQDKPHVNYLVALAAGNFHKVENKLGELPLALLVPPSEKDQALNAFRDTAEIIDFYNREIGVPFAWDKYYQVYCHDFLAGGMENTSCTFEASSMLFQADTEELRTLHRLDAHETVHQWFGDLVTCRDWSHLWLNEGFASYYTILYEEQRHGKEAMQYALWEEAEDVLNTKDTKPTVWRDYQDPMEQFDYRVYPKGAWILHMVRSRLGPELYRKGIKTYLERHRGQVVGTDDLFDVLEEVSGLSWDQFVDQWLYHGGVPELNVSYAWDATTKQAKITVKQTQKVDDAVRLFRFDLPVRFAVGGKTLDFKVDVKEADQDFHFELDAAPELLRIDPDYTLLARINFTPPLDFLKAQLKSDVIGRLLAVRALATKNDAASVETLKQVLNSDAFHGVRSEAARALKKIATPEARAALIGSLEQSDARPRQEVVNALAAFTEQDARNALWQQSLKEKNPLILATIIKTWGSRPGEAPVAAALRKYLESTSYREKLAAAATDALKAQDDASAADFILARIKRDPKNFGTYDMADALNSLAFLSRNNKDRSTVRNFLIEHLSNPKQQLRTAAAQALGTLGDPSAIAVLEPLTQVSKPYTDPTREAAEKAVQTLQSKLEAPVELRNLWQRVQDLQKKSETMESELKKLREKQSPQKAK